MKTNTSAQLFKEAQELIPGGVNSPVRAFKSVGGNPIFMQKAKGAYLVDEDGNSYIDLINSWGPMILGHAHPAIEQAVAEALPNSFSYGAPTRKEVDMAKTICAMMPSVEKVRMVNSGTEATMAAIRVARGYTGKSKIIKFEGCYHGHGDSFLIAAGSGAATIGVPDSPGVTQGIANDTLTAVYNSIEHVEKIIHENQNQIAAVIIEPVVGNMGCVLPQNDFLKKLRALCDTHNIVLIFDEVMTGFRLAPGGAQEVFGIKADLTTMGKIIGGGMPVGAYGGKKEIMNMVAPAGPVYQAGTLSGNPIAMSAGLAMLKLLNEKKSTLYKQLDAACDAICKGIQNAAEKNGHKIVINRFGSMMTVFFTQNNVVNNWQDAASCDREKFGKFFHGMLQRGVYLPPSQFEAWFISESIGATEIEKIVQAAEETFKTL